MIGQSTKDGGEPIGDNLTPRHLVSTLLHTAFDVGRLRSGRPASASAWPGWRRTCPPSPGACETQESPGHHLSHPPGLAGDSCSRNSNFIQQLRHAEKSTRQLAGCSGLSCVVLDCPRAMSPGRKPSMAARCREQPEFPFRHRHTR